MEFQNAWISDRTLCYLASAARDIAETHFDSKRVLEGVLNAALGSAPGRPGHGQPRITRNLAPDPGSWT